MKTTITTKLLLLSLLFINYSCESDAFFEVNDGHTKIFAMSEIHEDDKIKVHLSTAVGINTDDEYFYPKNNDAKITLYADGIALDNPGFRYISREKAYVSQGTFRPSPGIQYGLEITMQNEVYAHIPIAYAETSIPQKEYLTSANFTRSDVHTIYANLSLSDLVNEYYMINFIQDGMPANIKNFSNTEGLKLISDHSILIDRKRSVGSLNLEILKVSDVEELQVEVRTIHKDAYDYYRAYQGQLKEESYLLFEPVIDKSNFENGLGLFSGFATTTSTYPIQ